MAVKTTNSDGSMDIALRDNTKWAGWQTITKVELDPEEAQRLGDTAWEIVGAIAEGLNEDG